MTCDMCSELNAMIVKESDQDDTIAIYDRIRHRLQNEIVYNFYDQFCADANNIAGYNCPISHADLLRSRSVSLRCQMSVNHISALCSEMIKHTVPEKSNDMFITICLR